MYANEMNNKGKLIAAVLVLAMVVAAFAVISSENVNAVDENVVEVNGSTLTLDEAIAQYEGSPEPVTLKLTDDAVINTATVLNDKVTIDCDVYSITTKANITGGKIIGTTGGSESAVNTLLVIGAEKLTISGTDFSVTATDAGLMPFAIDAGAYSCNIDNCTFVGPALFGAVHINTSNVSIDTCNFGNYGMIVYKGSPLTINDSNVIINFVNYAGPDASGNSTVSTQITLDETSKIVKSIIGWEKSTIPSNLNGVYGGSNIILDVNKQIGLGDVSKGSAAPSSDTMSIKYGEGITPDHGTVTGVNTPDGNTPTADRMPLSDNIIAVNDRLEISGEAYISGDSLTISEGKTLVIMSGGDLNMYGKDLIVEGTLIIEAGATVSNGGTIVLVRGGTFDNSGTLGVGAATEITAELPSGYTDANYTGHGSVTVSNVSGMTFGFVNTTGTSNTPQYTLTVTGDLIAEDAENNSISVDGARIVGDLYVGQDVDLQIVSAELRSGVTVTVDGTLTSNGNLTMYNGSQIVVNGDIVGEVKAVTGDYLSSDGESKFLSNTYNGTKNSTFSASATDGFITGYTLSVGTYAFQFDSNKDDVMEAWTAQRLYIDGSLSYGADYTVAQPPTSGTITIGGNGMYVAADTTVVMPSSITINNAGSPVTVLGTIQFTNMAVPTAFDYVGASYNVKSTGTPVVTTGYVTTFANAMGAISTADQQKVTVKGDLDIDAEYTLAANQRLDLTNAGNVVIKNGGSLTLEARSIMSGDVDNVEGVMTIMKPNGSNAPLRYSTIAEGTTSDGVSYTRYSGLQYALDNANPGETIKVVGETEIDGNLTIPAGVTVSGENSISISGNLVIEETARLVMVDSNVLDMTGAKSKVTVNGELDVIEGSITFTSTESTTDTALTSTVGTTKWGTNAITGDNLPDAFNTVAYYNEDQQIVMTSPEAAIAAASAQDINKYVVASGNVTGGDIELTVDMLVRMDSNVTFGTITLADGVSILVNDEGRLTASVSAQTGVDGSETTSTVDLDGAAYIAIGEVDVVDNQNVTTHQLYIAGVPTGAVTVSAGTAVVGNNASSIMGISENYKSIDFDGTGDVTSTLTVATGATLQVNDGMTLVSGNNGTNSDQPAVIIDGTLAVAESGIVTVDGIMDVAGTMTVAAGNTTHVTVDAAGTLNVTGTLDISTAEDDEASIEVEGTLVAGDKITTMGGSSTGTVNGTVLFTSNGSLKAYNGTSVEGAVIGGDANADGVSDAKHTALYINGNLYMTVYSDSMNINDNYLANEDFALVGYDMSTNGYDIETLGDWYSDSEMTKSVTSPATVGSPEAMYFKVNASNVDVKISVGQGISLYVDNIRYVSGETVSLSVGTHSVTATVNPGFTGDVTVQFNGQTVTGEFTITPEMASNTYEGNLSLTATGNITQESVVIDGGNGDSGMGLTDYLLIILVVLIVIMAIMVAMRLMRS